MADAASGVGNGLTGVGGSALGGLAGSVQNTAQSLVGKGQGMLDKYFPPDKRAVLWAKFSKFMTERPKLGAFLLSQIALSGVPLGIFIVFSITVAIFSIVAALLIALIVSLLFIVFCIGVALAFLLPTLFFTTMVATFLFLWGLGTYYIIKWFNEKEIPGIHTDLVGGLKAKLLEDNGEADEADKVPALTGHNAAPPKLDKPAGGKQGAKQNGSRQNGGSSQAEGQQNGTGKKESKGDPVSDVGKSTGLDTGAVGEVKKKADVGNVNKTVGNVTEKADVGNVNKTVGNVTQNVPGGVL